MCLCQMSVQGWMGENQSLLWGNPGEQDTISQCQGALGLLEKKCHKADVLNNSIGNESINTEGYSEEVNRAGKGNMEEELLKKNTPFNPIVRHNGSLGTILPKHSSVHCVAYGTVLY